MMSLRSVVWSLCRWVRKSPRSAPAADPAPAARMRTPRPQSKSRSPALVRTRVAGPARAGSGSGLPLPRMMVCMGCLQVASARRTEKGAATGGVTTVATMPRAQRRGGGLVAQWNDEDVGALLGELGAHGFGGINPD